MTIQRANLRNQIVNVAPCHDMLLFHHYIHKAVLPWKFRSNFDLQNSTRIEVIVVCGWLRLSIPSREISQYDKHKSLTAVWWHWIQWNKVSLSHIVSCG